MFSNGQRFHIQNTEYKLDENKLSTLVRTFTSHTSDSDTEEQDGGILFQLYRWIISGPSSLDNFSGMP